MTNFLIVVGVLSVAAVAVLFASGLRRDVAYHAIIAAAGTYALCTIPERYLFESVAFVVVISLIFVLLWTRSPSRGRGKKFRSVAMIFLAASVNLIAVPNAPTPEAFSSSFSEYLVIVAVIVVAYLAPRTRSLVRGVMRREQVQ